MTKHEMRKEAIERLQKLLTSECGYGDVMKAVLGDYAFIYNSSRQDALSLIDLLTDDDDMGDYIKLPRDKYGEPWHIGDVTENGNVVTGMAIDSTGEWYFINIRNDIDPQIHYHYHKPTVEDVLRELVIACEDAGNAGPAVEALISKHAERLRLKEDE
jgi:hypothetical protein